MMAGGEFVGFFDQGEIVVGTIAANLAQEIAKFGHGKNVGRDLLAECRHERLYETYGVWPGARKISHWE